MNKILLEIETDDKIGVAELLRRLQGENVGIKIINIKTEHISEGDTYGKANSSSKKKDLPR